jgi:predicted phosphoribosyltransferase
MELSAIVTIIVIIAVGVVLIKLLGKVLSFVFSILGVIAVVWLITIGLKYIDEKDIRDKFLDSNNLYVLEDGSNIVTGFASMGPAPNVTAEDISQNSDLLSEYYKIIVVKKSALPEKSQVMIDALDPADQVLLLKHYVNATLLDGDVVDNLVTAEKEGNIEVFKKTIAFRQGIKEVLANN